MGPPRITYVACIHFSVLWVHERPRMTQGARGALTLVLTPPSLVPCPHHQRSLAAERKAVRAAKEAARKSGGKAAAGGMSKREQMRQRQLEMQEEADGKKKKKGFFGF